MLLHLLPLLFLAAVHAATCPVTLPNPSQTRVIGGIFPAPETVRHILSFPTIRCAATLISPTWAVTAAHCAVTTTTDAYVAGSSSTNGDAVSIKAVHIHPRNQRFLNDIALVELQSPVETLSNFMAVNANPDIPATREFARTVGYGYTHEDGANMDNDFLIRQVDLPVVSTEVCKSDIMQVNARLGRDITPAAHICAGYESGNCDTCFGDSGGPLFVYADDDTPVQVGIVSFGHGCARPGIPGGYTRISGYVEWMRSVGAEFTTATTRNAVFLEASDAGSSDDTKPSVDVAPNGDDKPNGNQDSTPSPVPTKTPASAENEDGTAVDTALNATPTPIIADPDGGSSSSSAATGQDDAGGSSTGAIVGGSVAGIAVIVIAIALISVYRSRAAAAAAATPTAEAEV